MLPPDEWPLLLPVFSLADLGIAHHPRADHAAYVASWLRALKDDPRAIFTAASKAQAAADWMHAQQISNACDDREAGETFVPRAAA